MGDCLKNKYLWVLSIQIEILLLDLTFFNKLIIIFKNKSCGLTSNIQTRKLHTATAVASSGEMVESGKMSGYGEEHA